MGQDQLSATATPVISGLILRHRERARCGGATAASRLPLPPFFSDSGRRWRAPAAAAVRGGRTVQGGAVRGPALRRERLDRLGPRAGRPVRPPHHGRRARRREASANMVVYLGDLVTANNVAIPNATLYWERALSPARRRGVPWATVFGNHDDMPFEWPQEWFSPAGVPPLHCPPSASVCSFRGMSRMELMAAEIDRGGGLSRSSVGPKDLWPGVSNYVQQVLSRKNDQDPALLMYFLDSGGGSYPEVISAAQLRWFQSQSQFFNPDGRTPELVFWHIPSTAYAKVAPKANSEIRKPCVGSLNQEEVALQAAEWGMMDALANRPSVKAIFVGHNHGLDWCCPYDDLWLCFAGHTGHGGYGRGPRGARIVEMSEKPFSVDSWIRMENGTRHSHIVLS